LKGYSDAQVFILRNIVICAVALIGDILFDLGRNFLYAVGLDASPHVYHFGLFQLIVLVFFSLFLAISINDWRYYK